MLKHNTDLRQHPNTYRVPERKDTLQNLSSWDNMYSFLSILWTVFRTRTQEYSVSDHDMHYLQHTALPRRHYFCSSMYPPPCSLLTHERILLFFFKCIHHPVDWSDTRTGWGGYTLMSLAQVMHATFSSWRMTTSACKCFPARQTGTSQSHSSIGSGNEIFSLAESCSCLV